MTEKKLTGLDYSDIISSVDYLRLLSEEMDDEDLTAALALVMSFVRKPDVPPEAAKDAIVQLSAISAKFATGAVYFKTFGKGSDEARMKKDVYYSMKEALNSLVDSVKYIIRAHENRPGRNF